MFCAKVSNAQDTSWMWLWGGKNIALLGLINQCMTQIPLNENILASQLIINSISFFMLTGAGLGVVKIKSIEPLSDPHVLGGKWALTQLLHPNDWCWLFEKREIFLCRGLELGGRVWLSVSASKSWASLETIDGWVVEMSTTLHNPPSIHLLYSESLWENPLSWFSYGFSFLFFLSQNRISKKYTWFYINVSYIKITCFYKNMFRF